ncbi:porin family protein [Flagellimonas sp. 389]|uniref:outer membrane beta-barrel protein n=1 Tax=Flagellimonas sp. 389 TaxID=2835862 RepID=UPI001BD33BE1|nr:outer membrane beta-barrel protein [Flagellimonas sp. 389]MBS9461158.1 porin family protein [Flagellimonas sp. 389]
MTRKILFSVVLLATISLTAQEKKWSVEANYPISISDNEVRTDLPGIVDLGIKYRFLEIGFARLGAGISAGVFHEDLDLNELPGAFTTKRTNWLIQPRVFMEFKIPALEKFRPAIGLGYTVVRSKFDNEHFPIEIRPESRTDTDGGININVGISYDITKRIFIQAQYDYVRNNITRSDLPDINEDSMFLKFGAGFRF